MSIKKILLVEDESSLSEALERKLEDKYYQITAVNNGEKAITELSENKYDLVLLDIILPVADGFDVLKIIKKKKIEVPVFILSNLDQATVTNKVEEFHLQEWVTEIFTKANVPIHVLVDHIKHFLNKNNL